MRKAPLNYESSKGLLTRRCTSHERKRIRAEEKIVNTYRSSGGNCRPSLSLSQALWQWLSCQKNSAFTIFAGHAMPAIRHRWHRLLKVSSAHVCPVGILTRNNTNPAHKTPPMLCRAWSMETSACQQLCLNISHRVIRQPRFLPSSALPKPSLFAVRRWSSEQLYAAQHRLCRERGSSEHQRSAVQEFHLQDMSSILRMMEALRFRQERADTCWQYR